MPLEFKFLIGPEIEAAEQHLPPDQRISWPIDSIVMYAFSGDEIIGRMGVMSIKLIEGTWASEGYPTLAFRMMKQMEAMLAYLGNTAAMAMVYDEQPQIADYLERVGFIRFPVTLYQHELARKENAV